MPGEIIQNPYSLTAQQNTATNHSGAMQEILASREIAEAQSAMFIAQRFPRNPVAVADKVINDCTRLGLAESAMYSYARGSSIVSGPSIRLAEALAQRWGNMQFGLRILERSAASTTVEAFAWDMEANTRITKTFHVEHIRNTRKGSYRLEEERDIRELIDNQGSRHLRGCILRIIPGELLETALRQCEITLANKTDTSSEGIKKMQAAFEGFGVTRAQIEKRFSVRMDAIRPAQIVELKKIYVSLKDGVSTAADWFEPIENETPAADKKSLRDKVAEKAVQITQSSETADNPTQESTAQ